MMGMTTLANTVTASTAGHGTSGHVSKTIPPNTTRKVPKITVVLMITAPTQ